MDTGQFAALLAMKGMMLQDNATLDEALKKMEEGQMANSKGPALPPRVIGKSLRAFVEKEVIFSISCMQLFLLRLALKTRTLTTPRAVKIW